MRVSIVILLGLMVGTGGALCFSPQTVMAQQDVLGLNTGTDAPYTTEDRKGFLDLMVAEVFQRIGQKAQVNRYVGASARALQMSNSGKDDGEALRIKGLKKKFPNLVMIPESIIANDFVAYSIKPIEKITNWNSLKPYSISYLIGWQIFANNTKGAERVTTVRGVDQLFSLLKLERVDLSLYERWQGLYQARLAGVEVITHEPPLARMDMYMYLHKKHAALAPKAAKALAQMKKDGSYQRIVDMTLTPLLKKSS